MTTTTPSTDRYSHSRSDQFFERARALMPGGVSSPVRAYQAVGRQPITVLEGKGAYVTDVDGNRYVDYVGSYGPLILGHAPEAVIETLRVVAGRGTSFGMPTEAESVLAGMIIDAVPSIQMVRFVNSGTEATMSAIRLARAAAGGGGARGGENGGENGGERTKIIKCAGCYHGHSDGLLVQAGSGATTLGVPSSPGVPASVTGQTVVVPFNDLGAMDEAMRRHSGRVAAVIIEPVAGNMGCVPPGEGYLAGLRRLCDEHGVILIFDEVMTGFRVAYGGAQSLYGVRPDLTCLGKVIGGGLPCAAYGGRADLMRLVAPEGPVYQAGTLSGNPLAMAAGITTLDALRVPGVYERLDAVAGRLVRGLEAAAAGAGVAVTCRRVGSMVGCFFAGGPIENYDQAVRCDTGAFARFFGQMLDRGVVLPPSQFETWFVSTQHDGESIGQTVAAAEQAFGAMMDR